MVWLPQYADLKLLRFSYRYYYRIKLDELSICSGTFQAIAINNIGTLRVAYRLVITFHAEILSTVSL